MIDAFAEVGSSHEFVLFLNLDCRDHFPDLPRNFTTVLCRISGKVRPLRVMYEQCILPIVARRHGIDILHTVGETSPLFPGCPAVITIHGMNYWLCPEYFTMFQKMLPRIFIRQAVCSADHIIAVSDFVRDRLIDRLGADPQAVTAIHYGAPQIAEQEASGGTDEDISVLQKHGVTPPYLLTVASPWPHKNVAGLISAYRELVRTGPAPPLVIVGHSVEHMPAVARELGSLGDKENVVFTGYFPFNELPVFYRNAHVFLFGSLGEGFGLPIHEAMSFGIPVVTSNAMSLPEVAGDAAILEDITDSVSFAREIRRVLDDSNLREELTRRGRERVREFSWEKAACETLSLYQKVAQKR
jgi:glycosyltransferase involved in cell wall biosynthesis